MNSKLFKIMISSIAVILIVGVGALIYILNSSDGENEELSIEKMVEYSYTTDEMSTDLKDGSFVRMQFDIITDSKKARTEIENRSFQFKNIFIKESVNLTEADVQAGLTELETKLKDQMNELMDEGNIIDVYIISKVIQ
ncbi:flagellar basal body-associated FliL family protein [Paraliobacillus sp. X-1268]|uniref:flagellar basal body-associated FliL family protein n=1 Tax=Paraliobacillus sp. X-1268 TaxID=2213193 RepID=UPI000E3DDE56|nr:flagellar basal body-associated FliL family protein [Paraliobacillus sp. X-1268]